MNQRIYFLIVLLILIMLSYKAIAQSPDRNTILFDAMSPYEDLTEYALDEDIDGVEKSIRSLEGSVEKLNNILSKESIQSLNAISKKTKAAVNNANYPVIALYAVDSYKAIAEELDVSKLNIPKEVALLDYVGFKLQALLKQNIIEWVAINEVTLESANLWSKIKDNVSDNGLRDTMDTAINGIQTAAKLKNIEMLKFSAQVDLDLVDLLEGYFNKK